MGGAFTMQGLESELLLPAGALQQLLWQWLADSLQKLRPKKVYYFSAPQQPALGARNPNKRPAPRWKATPLNGNTLEKIKQLRRPNQALLYCDWRAALLLPEQLQQAGSYDFWLLPFDNGLPAALYLGPRFDLPASGLGSLPQVRAYCQSRGLRCQIEKPVPAADSVKGLVSVLFYMGRQPQAEYEKRSRQLEQLLQAAMQA